MGHACMQFCRQHTSITGWLVALQVQSTEKEKKTMEVVPCPCARHLLVVEENFHKQLDPGHLISPILFSSVMTREENLHPVPFRHDKKTIAYKIWYSVAVKILHVALYFSWYDKNDVIQLCYDKEEKHYV